MKRYKFRNPEKAVQIQPFITPQSPSNEGQNELPSLQSYTSTPAQTNSRNQRSYSDQPRRYTPQVTTHGGYVSHSVTPRTQNHPTAPRLQVHNSTTPRIQHTKGRFVQHSATPRLQRTHSAYTHNRRMHQNRHQTALSPKHNASIPSQPTSAPKNSHSYIVNAHFSSNHILSVSVFDAIHKRSFRSEFTQNMFPYYIFSDIVSILMQAIHNAKNTQMVTRLKPLSIMEHGKWCYVTVNGASMPSFALRPVM